MADYKIRLMRGIYKQLALGPERVRIAQCKNVEKLLEEIDIDQIYPFDYIRYRITGYAEDGTGAETFTGHSLRADLSKLLTELSATVSVHAEEVGEPVYTLKEIERVYNISTRTLFRWRRSGLISRKFIFNGGVKLTGVRKSWLDRFWRRNRERIRRSSRFSHLSDIEKRRILGLARKYSAEGVGFSEATLRISHAVGRSREAIRYTLRTYEETHPNSRIFPNTTTPLSEAQKQAIWDAFKDGVSVAEICRKFGRSRSTIYRVVNQRRLGGLLDEPTQYMYSPEFEKKGAEKKILGPEPPGPPPPFRPSRDAGQGMPPYLRSLYDTPLLSKEQEVYLFRKYNYLKFHIAQLKEKLCASAPRARMLQKIEALQQEALKTKNRILQANLRLVVNIAKRHAGPLTDLFALISEGNICLIRAIEKFDYTRGNKFSTYASWAIVKHFARVIPEENYVLNTFATGMEDILVQTGRVMPDALAENEFVAKVKDTVRTVLGHLSERERSVVISRFGLDNNERPRTLDEIGKAFGVTRERIRQIEAKALRKLKALLEIEGTLEFT